MLALLHELEVTLTPPASPPPGSPKASTASSPAATPAALAPWLARHGHRLHKLVLTADSAAGVDAVLAGLLASAEANCTTRPSVVRRILDVFAPPRKMLAVPAAAPATVDSPCCPPVPGCMLVPADSAVPQRRRTSLDGLQLQQLELRVPSHTFLRRSTGSKLAGICCHAPQLQVVVICNSAPQQALA